MKISSFSNNLILKKYNSKNINSKNIIIPNNFETNKMNLSFTGLSAISRAGLFIDSKIDNDKKAVDTEQIIKDSDLILKESQNIIKNSKNIKLYADDIIAESEKIKQIKNLDIKYINIESNAIYKDSKILLEKAKRALKDVIKLSPDLYSDSKTEYRLPILFEDKKTRIAEFTTSDGNINMQKLVTFNQNESVDIIYSSKENQVACVELGVFDYNNAFHNIYDTYFYLNGNGNLESVDKNYPLKKEKVYCYEDGCLCSFKKNYTEKENGIYNIEQMLLFDKGKLLEIENNISVLRGDYRVDESFNYGDGDLVLYIKDIHKTRRDETLTGKEFLYENGILVNYNEGRISTEDKEKLSKYIVFKNGNLSTYTDNSTVENRTFVEKEKEFSFKDGELIEYVKNFKRLENQETLTKENVFRFEDDKLICHYQDWIKTKDENIKIAKAYKFKDNNLNKFDLDLQIKKDGVININRSMLFDNGVLTFYKKKYTGNFNSVQ